MGGFARKAVPKPTLTRHVFPTTRDWETDPANPTPECISIISDQTDSHDEERGSGGLAGVALNVSGV